MDQTKEKLIAFCSPVYNTCVEYYGERREIIDFLSKFDVWGSKGRRIEDKENISYRFEFSKEIYPYLKTDDFKYVMKRLNIECEIH